MVALLTDYKTFPLK